jgi:hypothetical protein
MSLISLHGFWCIGGVDNHIDKSWPFDVELSFCYLWILIRKCWRFLFVAAKFTDDLILRIFGGLWCWK